MHCKRTTGLALNLEHAYWTPPLSGGRAFELERRQIESIGLLPMVSLSDHDTIEASLQLREKLETVDAPISVEWTAPWGASKFHLGLHNLSASLARDIMSSLRACTATREDGKVREMIAELHSMPSVLIVFNHPVWNLYDLPENIFQFELDRFLVENGRFLHAFELNGLRRREENQRVADLAAKWNQVLVSGGDRHGCEPNANLNLTRAEDFEEFISEIRNERRSTVLFMPQYEEPMGLRLWQNFLDIIREYPNYPEGQRKWDERTYHPDHAGAVVPVYKLWPNGTPSLFRKLFGAALLMEHRHVRETMRGLIPGDRNQLFLASEHSTACAELSPAWYD
ncbi:hypothetical protein ACPOL_2001 [Acidisarcina polymorpha]|uniref:PHP domain-containing protein n=1 Tax=Acidisarcina polymorpha TaxID=2211140 RepID=A0A2Z5FXZ1_9BACT|nr:hypothetical protein ACPOL_2001 [Acidisarcina polymorpha]